MSSSSLVPNSVGGLAALHLQGVSSVLQESVQNFSPVKAGSSRPPVRWGAHKRTPTCTVQATRPCELSSSKLISCVVSGEVVQVQRHELGYLVVFLIQKSGFGLNEGLTPWSKVQQHNFLLYAAFLGAICTDMASTVYI